MEEASTRLRLSILGLVAVSLFGALFARLYYLQVMEAPQFQVQAEANTTRTITEEAPRGRILDRNGAVLVENRTSLVVKMDRPEFLALPTAEADELKLRLAAAITDFGVPTKVSDVDDAVNDNQFDVLQPVPVAIDVPEALMLYIAERESEFPSISVVRESVRSYPDEARGPTGAPAAAHVLGYVGPINEEELEAKQGTRAEPKDNPKPYQPNSSIGKGGVEAAYEDELRGTPGERVLEVNANGDPVKTVSYTPPIPGNDVQLTLDLDLQKASEAALVEMLDRQRGTSQSVRENGRRYTLSAAAPGGAAVVTDPGDGAIRVMASYPTYDPAEFVNGISKTRYDQLKDDPAQPLLNRALQGQYAPGSTFKPFTAFAAMRAGLMQPGDTVNDDGVYERANDETTWSNYDDAGHGPVNLAKSLTVSSDWYYYNLGDLFWLKEGTGTGRVAPNAQQDGYRELGFGSASGVDLPGESRGVVPDREWKEQLYDAMSEEDQKYGSPDWIPGDNMAMAIGQGDMLVTPLQLANGYATLANGGTVHQPHIVWRILAPPTSSSDPQAVVREIEPVVVRQIDLDPSFLEAAGAGLEGVLTTGTAAPVFRGFDLAVYPIAGKTGTAQVEGKVDSSWFAAYGPVGYPSFAVAAVLEEAGDGSDGGAPVVRRIFEHTSGQQETAAADIDAGAE